MKFATIYIALITCATNTLLAQNIKNDLSKINQNYFVKEYYVEIGYKYFTGNVLTEDANATYVQSNNSYYFKIKDLEILNNAKCQLMVNHFLKTISVMPTGNTTGYEDFTKIPIDSTLKGVKGYSFKDITDKVGRYTIHLKKGEYKTIEISFNKNNYSVSKIKMYVSDAYAAQDSDMKGGALEVTYKTFKKYIPTEKKKLLSESSFVKIRKEKVSIASSYINYELNDYLNIKPE